MSLKESIVEEASYQIKRGGWNELNFDTIAEKLNTTRSNLHYHFKTKEKLANEVMERFVSNNITKFDTIFEMTNQNFPEMVRKIEEFIFKGWKADSNQGFCACSPFLTNSGTVPKSLRDKASSYFVQQIDYWSHLISVSKEKGYIQSSLDPESLARQFLMIFLGFRTLGNASRPIKNSPFKETLSDWATSIEAA